jgi:hypothetical protein
MAPLGETDLEQRVRIEDSKVIVEKLVIDDRDIAEYLAAVKDQVQGIVEALQVGARVLRIAATSGDVEMVKREFETIVGSINTSVDGVLEEAKKAIEKRLTEFTNEGLQKSLREHKNEIQQELVKLFGPESAVSVQKQIDEMLAIQGRSYTQELARVLEQTDDPENPFFKLRRELKEEVERGVKTINDLRDKLMEVVGEAKGAAVERERGTAKGREYQDYAYEEVERIARVFGDIAENVADQPGEKPKSKAGDVLVTLNPRDTSEADLRIVFEVKNRSSTVPQILRELDESKENRIAAAAVAVFSSVDYVPSGLRSWRDYPGHRYICVLLERGDPYPLELAYRWARFDALRSIEIAEPKLDFAAVQNVLRQVRARLNQLQQMQIKLSGAQGAIGDVQNIVEQYRQAMRMDLDEIDRLLSVR